jgi:hypothetical protein
MSKTLEQASGRVARTQIVSYLIHARALAQAPKYSDPSDKKNTTSGTAPFDSRGDLRTSMAKTREGCTKSPPHTLCLYRNRDP